MELHKSELVDGTEIKIGHRLLRRKVDGQTIKKPMKTYSAVYKELDAKWVIRSLRTTNRREARRKALEIQVRLEEGRQEVAPRRIRTDELIDAYETKMECEQLAPKTISKYRADLAKLREFVKGEQIAMADRFDEMVFYRFQRWLQNQSHSRAEEYAPKTVYAALTLCKQVFKWGWKQKLLPDYVLSSAKLPKAKARSQPCFTTKQVELLLSHAKAKTHDAIAILAYTGLRVGELQQLEWSDVLLNRGSLGMLHIRRGGSGDGPKDKEDRFVPIHPRIRSIFERLDRHREGRRVMPKLKPDRLLLSIKKLCVDAGLSSDFKTHSLRHHFASMCANHRIAHRKALAWLGHSSSDILDLYYHLHDEESQAAMQSLADDHGWKSESADSPVSPLTSNPQFLINELNTQFHTLDDNDITALKQILTKATDRS